MSESEKPNLDKEVAPDASNRGRMNRREFALKSLGTIAGITLIGLVGQNAGACPCCRDSEDTNCTTEGGGDENCHWNNSEDMDIDNNCGNDYDEDNDCVDNEQNTGSSGCGVLDFSYDTDSNCGNNEGSSTGPIDTDNCCGDCGQPDNHDSDQDCEHGLSGDYSDNNCGDGHYPPVPAHDNDENCGSDLGSMLSDHDNSCGYQDIPGFAEEDNNCGAVRGTGQRDPDEDCGWLIGHTDSNCCQNPAVDTDCDNGWGACDDN